MSLSSLLEKLSVITGKQEKQKLLKQNLEVLQQIFDIIDKNSFQQTDMNKGTITANAWFTLT